MAANAQDTLREIKHIQVYLTGTVAFNDYQ